MTVVEMGVYKGKEYEGKIDIQEVRCVSTFYLLLLLTIPHKFGTAGTLLAPQKKDKTAKESPLIFYFSTNMS